MPVSVKVMADRKLSYTDLFVHFIPNKIWNEISGFIPASEIVGFYNNNTSNICKDSFENPLVIYKSGLLYRNDSDNAKWKFYPFADMENYSGPKDKLNGGEEMTISLSNNQTENFYACNRTS